MFPRSARHNPAYTLTTARFLVGEAGFYTGTMRVTLSASGLVLLVTLCRAASSCATPPKLPRVTKEQASPDITHVRTCRPHQLVKGSSRSPEVRCSGAPCAQRCAKAPLGTFTHLSPRPRLARKGDRRASGTLHENSISTQRRWPVTTCYGIGARCARALYRTQVCVTRRQFSSINVPQALEHRLVGATSEGGPFGCHGSYSRLNHVGHFMERLTPNLPLAGRYACATVSPSAS